MSLESAKACVERITTDEEFRNKIAACKDAKERMELAKSEGFDFTSEEIKQVSTEMDSDDLEKIVGAGGQPPVPPPSSAGGWWNPAQGRPLPISNPYEWTTKLFKQ